MLSPSRRSVLAPAPRAATRRADGSEPPPQGLRGRSGGLLRARRRGAHGGGAPQGCVTGRRGQRSTAGKEGRVLFVFYTSDGPSPRRRGGTGTREQLRGGASRERFTAGPLLPHGPAASRPARRGRRRHHFSRSLARAAGP